MHPHAMTIEYAILIDIDLPDILDLQHWETRLILVHRKVFLFKHNPAHANTPWRARGEGNFHLLAEGGDMGR
jgi:hypothetical protein